eukprot:TRINITY_DN1729_c0_g1_i2.p1 TRINITY_DN1729_c0_g1~~TRINITY_DN1729_c0_g1_i2.p1  ORF type:complete len:157 (+),score=81.45 TRINITY_DN1729_c0_g1_i2:256-726(+)
MNDESDNQDDVLEKDFDGDEPDFTPNVSDDEGINDSELDEKEKEGDEEDEENEEENGEKEKEKEEGAETEESAKKNQANRETKTKSKEESKGRRNQLTTEIVEGYLRQKGEVSFKKLNRKFKKYHGASKLKSMLDKIAELVSDEVTNAKKYRLKKK